MNKIFCKTKNVKGFMELIYNLQNKPDNISKIGLIYGEAGLGKTKTALYLSIKLFVNLRIPLKMYIRNFERLIYSVFCVLSARLSVIFEPLYDKSSFFPWGIYSKV